MKPTAVADFPSLLRYLREQLDWPFFEDDPDDNSFEYTPDELGIDPKWSVAIERVSQLRPSEGDGPWGIFYLEFEKKRLPVVVLRRILRALVPKARAGANPASRPAWKARDLLFVCATGESGGRGITFAHFHEVAAHHIAQLRTFGWDETESHIAPLASKLEALRWENQDHWERAFTLRHGQLVGDSKALATELAVFARRIRARTLELYGVETPQGQLHILHAAFRKALIADLSPEGFADTVAQTIAYGLFAGRATGATLEQVGLAHLETFVPATNHFLRELFAQFTRLGLDVGKGVDFDDLGIVDLVEFLNGIPVKEITDNFGRQSGGGGEDPVVYFYENFLREYDDKQRVQRGVYYTPKPVVDFIVRGVHRLLIEELGIADGLADVSTHTVNGATHFKVLILDPATGTGTFLQSAIEVIYEHMAAKWRAEGKRTDAQLRAAWNAYVPEFLLPRLHGFELMMASYTVAHMKLGLKLQELGYDAKNPARLRVFLTNTLEPPHESAQKALDFPDFLAHEALAADQIKRDTPISVIIGNPPYANFGQMNRNQWILALLDDYKKGLQEKKLNLDDDFIKFLRLAEWMIGRESVGVVGMITSNTFLDGITHRQMRKHIYQSFNRVYSMNLHGSTKRAGRKGDENVFDIQQGVSISMFVKSNEKNREVYSFDLFGSRVEKFRWLSEAGFSDVSWIRLHDIEKSSRMGEFYFFTQKSRTHIEEYCEAESVSSIFPLIKNGIKTDRDELFMDDSSVELSERISTFYSQSGLKPPFSTKYRVEDSSSYHLLEKRRKSSFVSSNIKTLILYPFNSIFIYYSPEITSRPAWEVMQHMTQENFGLLFSRQAANGFKHVFSSKSLVNVNTLDTAGIFGGGPFAPLYLYPSKTQLAMDTDASVLGFGKDGRRANLAPAFVAQMGARVGLEWQSDGRGDLTTRFGPEDVLAYIYALFHAPAYRARYAEFLKTDFPRVPLTTDAALFRGLVEQGRALLTLHTMEDAGPATSPAPPGEVAAGFPKFENGRVKINAHGGFDNVPEAVWNFHIGGYQVAHKWLKDRKGRALTPADAAHYRHIISALGQTIERMEAIDELIEAAGGFPLVGSV